MTKPTTLAAFLLAAFLAANGAVMMIAPQTWYVSVPGVTLVGPFNIHFIRDIGAIYVALGTSLAWTARRPSAAPAAVMAAGWLAAHSLIHLRDAAFCGRPPLGELARDLPGVHLPTVVAIWVAYCAMRGRPAPLGDR